MSDPGQFQRPAETSVAGWDWIFSAGRPAADRWLGSDRRNAGGMAGKEPLPGGRVPGEADGSHEVLQARRWLAGTCFISKMAGIKRPVTTIDDQPFATKPGHPGTGSIK